MDLCPGIDCFPACHPRLRLQCIGKMNDHLLRFARGVAGSAGQNLATSMHQQAMMDKSCKMPMPSDISLLPQHHAFPVVSSAQVCQLLVSIAAKVWPPATGKGLLELYPSPGTASGLELPLPSCPFVPDLHCAFEPQDWSRACMQARKHTRTQHMTCKFTYIGLQATRLTPNTMPSPRGQGRKRYTLQETGL